MEYAVKGDYCSNDNNLLKVLASQYGENFVQEIDSAWQEESIDLKTNVDIVDDLRPLAHFLRAV